MHFVLIDFDLISNFVGTSPVIALIMMTSFAVAGVSDISTLDCEQFGGDQNISGKRERILM